MATYYVTTSGSNAAAGTSEGAAWADPGYAASIMTVGDLCYVKAGTYTLTTSTPGAGGPVVLLANKRIYFEGYSTTPGDRPLVGSGNQPVVDAGAITGIAIFLMDGDIASTNGWQYISNFKVDGQGNAGVTGIDLVNYGYCINCDAVDCTVKGFDSLAVNCRAEGCGVGFIQPAVQCVSVNCTTGFSSAGASYCIARGGTYGFKTVQASAIGEQYVGCIA